MKQKITSTAVMLFLAGIVFGQMSGLKSSENSDTPGDFLLDNDLYENFETWPPAGWTFIGNNWFQAETGTLFFLDDWSTGGVTTPLGGKKYVAMTSGIYPNDICWMISPSLIISKGDYLSFWMSIMPGPFSLDIMVSQTDSSINSFNETLVTFSFDDYLVYPWEKYKLDLSQYEGKSIYIAWKIGLPVGGFFSMIDMVRVGPTLITDAALLLNETPDYVPAGELVISGTILNQGSDSITQADVSWQVDDGPISTDRFQGFSVAEDSGYNFFCHDKYVTTPGNHTLKVKISQVNGLESDENPSNDTVSYLFYACSNSVPKMHLFEVFTSSTCGACPGFNKNLVEPATQKYNGKVAVVKYQMSFPGSGDKYYISEDGIRGGFYGIGWVPVFYIDGISSYWLMDNIPYEEGLGYIDDLFSSVNDQLAIVEIKSKHTISQSTKNIELDATITPYFSGTGYRAFICVVEKVTTGNAVSDNEPEFYSVLMKMLPDAQGIPMNFVDGIPENINLAASLGDTYIEEFSDLAVVLFIQDMNTKKVIQAAYSEDTTTATSDANLTIFHKGIDVTNKEVSLEGNATDDELIAYLKINNPSDKQVQVKVRKIENSVVPGSENSFCLGVCYAPSVLESVLPYTISAGESINDSVFYVIYCPRGNPGQSVIKYEVFDTYNPEINKVSVTVNFIASPPSGIDKYLTAKEILIVYPNPCSLDQVTIRLHESGTVHFNKIILTNSSGIVLNSFSITDHTDNFLVDVHDYPNGIYYLFLSIEGGPLRMEKIIINR